MLEHLIEKIKLKKSQKRCYEAHIKAGLLYLNGKCNGHYEKINGYKFPTKQCSGCPYIKGGK